MLPEGSFFCLIQLLRNTFPWEIDLNAFQGSVTLPGYTHFSMAPSLSSSKSISFTWCQRSILVFKLPSRWIRYGKPVNFIGYKKALRGRTVERNIKARLQTIYCFFFQQQRGKNHSLSCNVIHGSFHKALIMQFINLALVVFTIFFVYIPLAWGCPHIKKCPAPNMSAEEQTWSSCTGHGWFCEWKLPNISRCKASWKLKEMNSEFWASFLIHCFLLIKPQLSRKNDYSNSFFSSPESTKFAWLLLHKLGFETTSKNKNVNQ